MALFGVRITNQLLMHQKSMQITCGRTDEYETWCLILTGMNGHRGYYQQKVCLFGTLMAYCEHFLGERIRGETKMLTFIHWSSGIKLPTVCWFYLKLSVLKCAREFPQATEFENFLFCLVLLITRNVHFYFAFKYPLLFWGIIMAARSMFSCCRHEATSLVGMKQHRLPACTQNSLKYRFLEVLLCF